MEFIEGEQPASHETFVPSNSSFMRWLQTTRQLYGSISLTVVPNLPAESADGHNPLW